MIETCELPPYMQLKLKHAKEDIDTKVRRTYVEKVFAYELFVFDKLVEDAVRERSLERAREALEYAQHVLLITGYYSDHWFT